MGVTHTFASVIADDPADAAAGKVLPSHWNAAHTTSIDLATEVSNAGFDYSDTQGVTLLPTTVGAGDTAAVLYHDTANSTGSGGYDWKLLYNGGNELTNGPIGDATYIDDVWSMGLNIGSVVGTRADAAKPLLAITMESKFYQNSSQLIPRSELHFETVDTSDVQHRALSFEVAHDGSFSGMAITNTETNFYDNSGAQRIKFDFVGATSSISYPVAAVHTFGVNNVSFLRQINTSGAGYINLPYIDSGNLLKVDSPVYINAARAGASATFPGCFFTLYPSTITSGDTVLYMPGVGVTGSQYSIQAVGAASTDYIFAHYNNSNNTTANAKVELRTIGSGGGDPFIHFNINGLGTFALGIDNSDSDVFKISANASLGSSDVLKIDSAGLATFYGNVVTANATNGQVLGIKSLTELLTIAAAATSTTTIQKPANSIILGVSVRVTTAVTCTSTFTVGDSTSAARFSTAAVSKALNSTDKGTKAGAYYNATAEGIVVTPDTTPSDATGRVRVTIHYLEVTPPTS